VNGGFVLQADLVDIKCEAIEKPTEAGTFKGQYFINLTPVSETDTVYKIRHTSKATTKYVSTCFWQFTFMVSTRTPTQQCQA
jgi:hypothetical protein